MLTRRSIQTGIFDYMRASICAMRKIKSHSVLACALLNSFNSIPFANNAENLCTLALNRWKRKICNFETFYRAIAIRSLSILPSRFYHVERKGDKSLRCSLRDNESCRDTPCATESREYFSFLLPLFFENSPHRERRSELDGWGLCFLFFFFFCYEPRRSPFMCKLISTTSRWHDNVFEFRPQFFSSLFNGEMQDASACRTSHSRTDNRSILRLTVEYRQLIRISMRILIRRNWWVVTVKAKEII